MMGIHGQYQYQTEQTNILPRVTEETSRDNSVRESKTSMTSTNKQELIDVKNRIKQLMHNKNNSAFKVRQSSDYNSKGIDEYNNKV